MPLRMQNITICNITGTYILFLYFYSTHLSPEQAAPTLPVAIHLTHPKPMNVARVRLRMLA